MKKFYSNIIEIESLLVTFDELDLSDQQKHHLAILTDSMLHNTILDAILSELPEEDKTEFLKRVSENDHDKTWELLNDKIDNVSDKIKKVAEDLKKELHTDLEEAKVKK